MVMLDRIHLRIGYYQNVYFHVNRQLEHGGNIVECQLEDQQLFIDRIKTDENGEPIMIQDPEEGEIPLVESVLFDKEVKGLLRMDFVLDKSDGTVSSTVLLLPEGVESVLGYNATASTTNYTGKDVLK